MEPKRAILIISLICLTFLPSSSQDTDGEYLFRDSKVKLTTFYVELNPSTSFSFLNGQMANITELAAGFILNNKFYFSYFMTGSPKINTVAIPDPFSDQWNDWVDAGVELENLILAGRIYVWLYRRT